MKKMGEIIHEADLNKMDAATVFDEVLKTPFAWPLYFMAHVCVEMARVAYRWMRFVGKSAIQLAHQQVSSLKYQLH